MLDLLGFYDMKNKKKFSTDDYKIVIKGNRRFAVAVSPEGIDCWRILKKV